MVFLNRFGSLFQQNLSRNIVSSGQAQLPFMLNAVRHMSGSRLFVGGLPFGIYASLLKEAFSNFGNVVNVKIVAHRDTGKPKGYGFVTFSNDESASAALAMNGQDINGRIITVRYASDESPAHAIRQPISSYSKGGGGNSGNGGGGSSGS